MSGMSEMSTDEAAATTAVEEAKDMDTGSQLPDPPQNPAGPPEKDAITTPMETEDTDGLPVEDLITALDSLQHQTNETAA